MCQELLAQRFGLPPSKSLRLVSKWLSLRDLSWRLEIMAKSILLFSSDAKALYQGDIFRALALPMDHVLQFRYPKQYVLEKYREDTESLIGENATVFFVSGNKQDTPEAERRLLFHPIRSSNIVDAFYDNVSEQVILMLKLGDFVRCELDSTTEKPNLPPHRFLSEGNTNDFRSIEWKPAVDSIIQYFPKTLFYRISGILRNGSPITPKYSKEQRLCSFILKEECDYCIECTYYHSESGQAPLRIDVSTEAALDVRNLFEQGAGAELDTKSFPLKTRALKSRSAFASIRFYSKPSETTDVTKPANPDPNYVDLHFELIQKPSKPWLFGLFTALGALGFLLVQTGLRDSAGHFIGWGNVCLRVGGASLMGIGAGCLFRLFNKI